ncbi:MAG: TlpA disulfide reductase family protein [bacterium]|nr:TlpA disulfide reductase family protein [bacterium]
MLTNFNCLMERFKFVCLVLALLLVVSACQTKPESKGSQKSQTAGKAPSFLLDDLDGRPVRSESFAGKVMIVNFWASWCGPCRLEIPHLIALYDAYRDQGVVVIGIAIDPAGPEVLKSFAEEMEVNYPMLVGDEKVFNEFGGLFGLPTTFVVDQSGVIQNKFVGLVDPSLFEDEVLALLK